MGYSLRAHSLLADLAIAIRAQLRPRQDWQEDGYAFGVDPFLDYRDAEFHLRALHRILENNRHAQVPLDYRTAK